MRKIYILIISILFSTFVWSQNLEGVITGINTDGEEEPLGGANLFWLGAQIGTITDVNGYYSLEIPDSKDKRLRISYVGYYPDTVHVNEVSELNVTLRSRSELSGVTIEGDQSSVNIMSTGPINTEQINGKELLKAPCCNLSESFETSVTVDAEFNDAVTGARTIRMLGLDGVYAFVAVEGIPAVRGLSSGYGLNFIPGSWIESIQITKGTGSVVYGYEGMTGSINAEMKKPNGEDAERFFLNLFGSNSGRWEINVNSAIPISDKLYTGILAHTAQNHTPIDHNGDGFLDMPQNNTSAFMNRWVLLTDKGYQSQLAVKYVNQDLQSGQVAFNPDVSPEEQDSYGIDVATERWEVFWKNGLVFNRPLTSAGLILSAIDHNQISLFGRDVYKGREKYFHADLLSKTYLFNTNHTIKLGGSFLYNSFDESFRNIELQREEMVPGVFTEYHFNLNENLNILAGLRTDFHNLYGNFITPRLHVKYNFTPNTTVRLSGGKAYRVANVLAENTSLFISSKTIDIQDQLRPEESWSMGATLIQRFPLFNRNSTVTVDFYRTDFTEQVVVDRYTDADVISIYNLQGSSWSHASQAEWMMQPGRNFDIRLAYRWVDVVSSFNGEEKSIPLVPVHRAMINGSYNWKQAGWIFDGTLQYYGQSSLPNTTGLPDTENLTGQSPDYILANAQVTKQFGVLDLYLGVENLTNYTQSNPILGADDPFGAGFDATIIYAPIMNRRYYAGLRLKL